ncbi:hypothetical protein E9993_14470 [Labilibacter sediminis]|nr:hypothetical protein E9993_14470 [Labilibacter sediminis]
MKKTVLFLAAVLTFTVGMAQKGKVTTATTLLDQGDVEKAKEAIDEAMANEKSNTWPKTYIVAAKVYSNLAKKGKDDEGVIKAAEFYKKAIELDKKGDAKGKKIGRYKNEIGQSLLLFSGELTNAGVEAFNKEDFAGAVEAFDGLLELNANDYLIAIQGEKTDTLIIWNIALAAYNGKDWASAEKYFNQSVDLKYGGGDAIILMHQMYTETADSTKMGANLIKGFETYPEDNRILTYLINYYLDTKQNDKALDYLNTAIEGDDTNPSFYYARAVLNDNLKNVDLALEDYKTCLELDSEYFNALYNVGVLYFNQGVEKLNAANDETDTKKFREKKAAGEEILKEALPYFEKCLAIKPDEAAVMESLKNLYYRFEMMDKYNEVSERLKNL